MHFAVHVRESTDSTQAEVQRLAAAGAPEGTVVTARHQRAGRGRRGHEWWDAPGQSLLLSVLLRPSAPPAAVPQLSLVGGLAVAEALATVGVIARIRWPNDLMVDDRKVCGILAEASSEGLGDGAAELRYVILGIGINLNQTGFPEPLADRATSLRLVTGHPHDADAVLAAVLAHLERCYAAWQAGGFAALRAAWLAHALLPGQAVRLPDGREAVGEAVAEDGVLLARTAEGRLIPVVSGEAPEEATRHAAGH